MLGLNKLSDFVLQVATLILLGYSFYNLSKHSIRPLNLQVPFDKRSLASLG